MEDLHCIRSTPQEIMIKECINTSKELGALTTSKGFPFYLCVVEFNMKHPFLALKEWSATGE